MHDQQTQLGAALQHEESKLLACIHCGLCLEACPTYVHTGNENDSPRGRLYLMRAVEEDRLAADDASFAHHINRCLGCRACEQACPAGVQYGQLLEAARSDIETNRQSRTAIDLALRFVLKHVWLYPGRLRAAFAVARMMRTLRLPMLLLATRLPQTLAPRFAFALALLEGSSPAKFNRQKTKRVESAKAVSSDKYARVFLFTGCVTEGLFARVNRATERVLRINGYQPEAPTAQVCCGALHAHAGDLEGARVLARRNVDAFAAPEGGRQLPIVTNAGGCGAMLCSYGDLLADDPRYAARARAMSHAVKDISQQLAAAEIVEADAPIDESVVTYDASCHLMYGQGAVREPPQMLSAIKMLDLKLLVESDVCCGGAGVYNLLQPALSSRILAEKLNHIAQTKAQIVLTGNPGCHMQIAAGARLRGWRHLRVCHPIELLNEAYSESNHPS